MLIAALKEAPTLLAACSAFLDCVSILDIPVTISLNMPVGCLTLYSVTTFLVASVTEAETSLNSAPRLLAPLIAVFIIFAKGLKSTT